MAEKVKVSREIADAIEDRKRLCRYTFVDFMSVATSEKKFSSSASILNSLSVQKLAEILLNGYEVEQTPEEYLIGVYRSHLERPSIQPEWNDGFADGIKRTLEILDIKIKGINE